MNKLSNAQMEYLKEYNNSVYVYIIELVDKETPKMIILSNYTFDYVPPKCPKCLNSILNYGQKYCDDCGQRLDYPNDDDNQLKLL